MRMPTQHRRLQPAEPRREVPRRRREPNTVVPVRDVHPAERRPSCLGSLRRRVPSSRSSTRSRRRNYRRPPRARKPAEQLRERRRASPSHATIRPSCPAEPDAPDARAAHELREGEERRAAGMCLCLRSLWCAWRGCCCSCPSLRCLGSRCGRLSLCMRMRGSRMRSLRARGSRMRPRARIRAAQVRGRRDRAQRAEHDVEPERERVRVRRARRWLLCLCLGLRVGWLSWCLGLGLLRCLRLCLGCGIRGRGVCRRRRGRCRRGGSHRRPPPGNRLQRRHIIAIVVGVVRPRRLRRPPRNRLQRRDIIVPFPFVPILIALLLRGAEAKERPGEGHAGWKEEGRQYCYETVE
ncbi:hypothetical protein FB451DRAFT_1224875 [Mycena latifolia]|nr:hypothetical protein FB451DRAFT_1224875 [Mycena latifolia]